MHCRKSKSRKSQDERHLHSKKKQRKDFATYKSHDLVENKKNNSAKWVSEDFFSLRWFQYLLEGLKSSSKVASVCTDTFRFELFDKALSKNALLSSTPQDFLISQCSVLFVFYQKKKFLPCSYHFILYIQS